jgi:uncharacterized protein (DUF362 family)
MPHTENPTRRRFLKLLAAGGAAAAVPYAGMAASDPFRAMPFRAPGDKPATNIADALKYPRTEASMPGRYPGRVVEVTHAESVAGGTPVDEAARGMLERGMLALTGATALADAWRQFVTPDDVVGLKVNPVAGKELSTSHAVVRAVIGQLELAGVPRKNIVIWDRREFELHDAGFTPEAYPDIRIVGTEYKDAEGKFYDANHKPLGTSRIDPAWFYWADCEQAYDEETLPYMVNDGKQSYFSTIVTRDLTKIINIPILKNAGPTVTLCLKNLAYGAISNTGRLHKDLWAETCAQVCCFPPLRDKVVLNVVDGLIGCYQGGPGADAKYIIPFNTMLLGSDPVAVDRVGYDIMLKKRMETQVQKQESPRGTTFLAMAAEYKLGVADPAKIAHETIKLP